MIKIEIEGKNIHISSIEKLADEIRHKYANSNVRIVRENPPVSRSDRLAKAMEAVQNAASEVETLRDELQDWYDNLPDNLKDGEKGSMLEEAIGNLESIQSSLEDATGTDVEFPPMY